VKPPL
jgi:hypothetical protein